MRALDRDELDVLFSRLVTSLVSPADAKSAPQAYDLLRLVVTDLQLSAPARVRLLNSSLRTAGHQPVTWLYLEQFLRISSTTEADYQRVQLLWRAACYTSACSDELTVQDVTAAAISDLCELAERCAAAQGRQ